MKNWEIEYKAIFRKADQKIIIELDDSEITKLSVNDSKIDLDYEELRELNKKLTVFLDRVEQMKVEKLPVWKRFWV